MLPTKINERADPQKFFDLFEPGKMFVLHQTVAAIEYMYQEKSGPHMSMCARQACQGTTPQEDMVSALGGSLYFPTNNQTTILSHIWGGQNPDPFVESATEFFKPYHVVAYVREREYFKDHPMAMIELEVVQCLTPGWSGDLRFRIYRHHETTICTPERFKIPSWHKWNGVMNLSLGEPAVVVFDVAQFRHELQAEIESRALRRVLSAILCKTKAAKMPNGTILRLAVVDDTEVAASLASGWFK